MFRVKDRIKASWYKSISSFLQAVGKKEKAKFYMDKLMWEGLAVNDKDWWYLGYLYTKLNQWEKAALAFTYAVSISQGHPKYIYWLGKAREEMGNTKMAETLYDEALKKNANCWEALVSKGELKLNRKEYKEALSYYRECLKLRPNDARILNNIGLCCLALDELEEAEDRITKAVRISPHDEVIRYNYATVYLKKGHLRRAIEEFEKIDRGVNAEILCLIGYCYGLLQDYESSISYYNAALCLEPENGEILINIATIYAKSGDTKKAIEIYRKLLLLNPRDPELLNNIAWVYETLEDYIKAEGLYYRGLALSYGDPKIAYNLICCLKRQRKFIEALDIIEHLQKIPEWRRMALSSMAQIYENMGEVKLAVDCYNKALGLE